MGIGEDWNTLESTYGEGTGHLQARPHAAIQGHPNYRVDVAYAIHQSFSSYCTYLHVLYDKGLIDDQLLQAAITVQLPARVNLGSRN